MEYLLYVSRSRLGFMSRELWQASVSIFSLDLSSNCLVQTVQVIHHARYITLALAVQHAAYLMLCLETPV